MNTLYENPWFRVVAEDGYHWLVEDNARNGAAVLAIVDGSFALLVKVKRPAQQHRSALEIPRGYGKSGETSLQCACRELLEETGYRARPEQLKRLGRYQPNSAILASTVDLYLAELHSNDLVAGHDSEVGRWFYLGCTGLLLRSKGIATSQQTAHGLPAVKGDFMALDIGFGYGRERPVPTF